ncbi:MAG: hypothetical protein ACWA5P_02190 [bacterium]
MSEIPDGMITVEELSEITNIPAWEIIGLIRDGTLTGRLIDDQWYVSVEELQNQKAANDTNNKNKPSGMSIIKAIGIFAFLGQVFFILIQYSKMSPVITHSDDFIDVARVSSKTTDILSDTDIHSGNKTDSTSIDSTELSEPSFSFNKKDYSDLIDTTSDISKMPADQLTEDELIYLAEKKTFEVEHFVVIPDSASTYQKIFSSNPDTRELNKIQSIRKDLEKSDNILIAQEDSGGIQIAEFIENSESNYITFTGHNESGLLKLPSGESIELNKVAELCVEFAKRCVFLSCKSNDYISSTSNSGVNSELSFSDANSMIVAINKKSERSKNNEISYNDFSNYVSTELDKTLSEIQFRSKAIYHVKRVGKVSGIGGVSYTTNEYLSEDGQQQRDKPYN